MANWASSGPVDHFPHGDFFDVIANFRQAVAELALRCLGERPARRALDLGCAAGRASFELARRFPGWDDRWEPQRKAYPIPQSGTAEPSALNSPECIIGRGGNVDYDIADARVSRRHAKMLALHNRYYVQDLASANGTFLNGDRIENERHAPGDLLLLGGTLLRFELGTDLDSNYLNKLTLSTVLSLAEAVDQKDSYTGSHSQAVAEVAQQLALALGLNQAAAERIRIAGRLHDIGKIGVPDAVRRKPGPLDEAECALIRRHPVDWANILMPLEFLVDILPAVRHHHERFDGRGYLDGLRGTEATLEARIIQIADSYHAMTSNRIYREARSLEFVRHEFAIHAETQFDPQLPVALRDILPTLKVGARKMPQNA